MFKRNSTFGLHSIVGSIAIMGALLHPMAQAAFQLDSGNNPNKVSSIKISVDGNEVGISLSATRPADGGGLETYPFLSFGRGDNGESAQGELSLLRAVKGGGEVRLLAQGGVVEVECSAENGGDSKFYQRARVTIKDIPTTSNKRVWAFYDPRVGANDKGQPHFNGNYPDAYDRITTTGDLITLCDAAGTPYIDGTAAVLKLGNSGDRPTAGRYKEIDQNVSTVSFDVYVPMEGRQNSTTTAIFLAMGFVVDMDITPGDVATDPTLDDTVTGHNDVAFEAWVSSEPWWDTPPGVGDNETDEFNTLLPICDSPEAEDSACIISTSGIFAADGTTRIGGANDFSAWTTQISADEEEGNIFDSIIDLAPTAPIDSTGFAIPTGSIVNIAISWPTAGTVYGDVEYGEGDGKIDLQKLTADTPVKVNTALENTATNTWTIETRDDRVITTLIGEAKTTSAAISRDSWWPQCDVNFNPETGNVVSNDCGAEMESNVDDEYMVFSSVPARLAIIVDPVLEKVAGGLVSTNGQGFAFGMQTLDETNPAYEFTSSGPSYNSAGVERESDGFYYVCLPETYLTNVHSTTAATATSSWVGTRRDGTEVTDVTVEFTEGTCGLNDAGLVASVAEFGYSSPVFQLRAAVTAPGRPTITQVTVGDGQATVTFTPPASDGGADITTYTVTATASSGVITQECASSPCTVTGLTNGTAYTATVTATNSAGRGESSAPSESVTPAPAVAATPISTLPLFGLGILVSLLGFSGVRKLRQ